VLDGSKMWITNAPVADVAVIWARAEEGVVGFAVFTDSPGFAAREIKHKMSLRASSTGETTLDGVRLPEDARLSEARGLKAPLSCLTEARFGIIWGSMGAARDGRTAPGRSTDASIASGPISKATARSSPKSSSRASLGVPDRRLMGTTRTCRSASQRLTFMASFGGVVRGWTVPRGRTANRGPTGCQRPRDVGSSIGDGDRSVASKSWPTSKCSAVGSRTLEPCCAMAITCCDR
jgi:hypothetical protein